MSTTIRIHTFHIGLLLAVGLLMLAFGWVGFISSDDILYAAGAQGWLREFPYLGDTHWALRHPFVLSVAASFGLFGVSEFTLALPTLIYHLATLVLAYLFLARHFPHRPAFFAGLLAGVTPASPTTPVSSSPLRLPTRNSVALAPVNTRSHNRPAPLFQFGSWT